MNKDMTWFKRTALIISVTWFGTDALGSSLSPYLQVRNDHYLNLPPISMPDIRSKTASFSLVDSQLTAEFNRKYDERFGPIRNHEAYIISNPNQAIYSTNDKTYSTGTLEEDAQARRDFGEYMLRRLLEFQAEGLFRRDPNMRVAVKVKEKISNVDVKVDENLSIKVRYSFSENILNIVFANPYLDARISAETNEAHFIVGRMVKNLFYARLDAGHNGSMAASISKQLAPDVRGELVACSTPVVASPEVERAVIGSIIIRF